jgi:hypothetical protein
MVRVAGTPEIDGGDAGRVGQGASGLRPLAEFHRDPRYAGDLHRADMAWARHAAATGLPAGEIRAAIMAARDLAKKGSARRQRVCRAHRRQGAPAGGVGVPGGTSNRVAECKQIG